ncbi:MAG: 6,7-dimethyl-8-ribityllumazine synthase [Saprospiraceae bacterium]|nr:6,7-dimethyl-8-ribityllumazine synthase [Saprospiraceae bacterium]
MATHLRNFSSEQKQPLKNAEKTKVAIITANWHQEITQALTDGAFQKLLEHGILSDNIIQIEVPGAFELPQACKMVLSHKNVHAVICLGCVIKGETNHDEYINHAVAQGLTNLSMASGKPIIFGVLTTLTHEQAMERSSGKLGNKGEECAVAAVNMLILQQELTKTETKIGFS